MSQAKFPVPDSLIERINARYDYWYTEAWYELYPSYVAALTRLGW